jgi:ABC-type thiamine transport system substrate-binding protein
VQRYAPTNPLLSVASEDRREVEALKKGALQKLAEGFLSVMIVEEFQQQTAPERLSPPSHPVAHIANAKRSLTEA